MEKRVVFLEKKVDTVSRSLSGTIARLTAMEQFLQKQFGPRFLKCATSLNLQRFSDSSNSNQVKTYSRKKNATNSSYYLQQPQHNMQIETPPVMSDYLEEDIEEEDDGDMEEANPLAYVEIVDDEQEQGQADENQYYDDEEEYSMDQNQINQGEEYYPEMENYNDHQESDLSDLVIVGCRSEMNNSASRNNQQTPGFKTNSSRARSVVKKRPKLTPRTRITLPSKAQQNQSLRKLKLLAPKPEPYVAPYLNSYEEDQQSFNEQIDQDNVEYISLPESASSTVSLDDDSFSQNPNSDGTIGGSQEPEGLRAYYDVLPDKSVQCRICSKILKAGWHKFGRHYRTHTGEKPFACPHCGERFARKDNMHNHIKSKHERFSLEGSYVPNASYVSNANYLPPLPEQDIKPNINSFTE